MKKLKWLIEVGLCSIGIVLIFGSVGGYEVGTVPFYAVPLYIVVGFVCFAIIGVMENEN